MFCPQCGSPNDDEYAFCKQCGASLRRGETTAPAPAPPVAAPPPAAPLAGRATQYANFGQRLLAFILDSILAAIIAGMIGAMLGLMAGLGGAVTGADDSAVSDVVDLLGLLAEQRRVGYMKRCWSVPPTRRPWARWRWAS